MGMKEKEQQLNIMLENQIQSLLCDMEEAHKLCIMLLSKIIYGIVLVNLGLPPMFPMSKHF